MQINRTRALTSLFIGGMHSEGFPGPLLYLSTIDCNYQISASSQKLKHKPISRRCVFQGHQQQQAPSDHVLLECNPIRACSQCTEFPLSCPFSLPLLEFYSLGGGGRSPIDSLSNALHRSRSTDTGRVVRIPAAHQYFPPTCIFTIAQCGSGAVFMDLGVARCSL